MEKPGCRTKRASEPKRTEKMPSNDNEEFLLVDGRNNWPPTRAVHTTQ